MDMNREESILKPNVVFFGDTVPRASAQEATKKVISSHTHTHIHTCFGFRSSSLVKFIVQRFLRPEWRTILTLNNFLCQYSG